MLCHAIRIRSFAPNGAGLKWSRGFYKHFAPNGAKAIEFFHCEQDAELHLRLISANEAERQDRRSKRSASQRIDYRPKPGHTSRVVNPKENRAGQQVGDPVQDYQLAKARHIPSQHPQRHSMHSISVGSLTDQEHQHGTFRHFTHAQPRVRDLHPGARHDHRKEGQDFGGAGKSQKP